VGVVMQEWTSSLSFIIVSRGHSQPAAGGEMVSRWAAHCFFLGLKEFQHKIPSFLESKIWHHINVL
jgi:hypothetical protein